MDEKTWRDILQHPGYTASSTGSVKTPRGNILTPCRNGNNTYQVSLKGKDGQFVAYAVHHLIASVFHGPCPDGHRVLFHDGDHRNFAAENLYYGLKQRSTHPTTHHGSPTGKGQPPREPINDIWKRLLPETARMRAALAAQGMKILGGGR